MVLYCEHQLFGVKKNSKNLSPHFFGQRLQDVWEVQALKDIEFLSLVVESFLPAESSFEVVNCWAEVILHLSDQSTQFTEWLQKDAQGEEEQKKWMQAIPEFCNIAFMLQESPLPT